MAPKKLPDVFSTHSAAKFCRVTPMTIIRWIDEGRIQAYKTPGGHRRIMKADLQDFCRRNEIPMEWEERVPAGVQRVLIVDDDKEVVSTILDALIDNEGGSEAYEVEHTDNLFDGGRLCSTFRPEVIFLDLSLPGMNAQVIARSVRNDPHIAKARLIGIAEDGSHKPVVLDDMISHPIAKRAVRRVTGPLPRITPKG